MKELFPTLNPLKSCKKYGVPVWQCPLFLFLVMGILIIAVIIATYFIATLQIDDPMVVSLIVLFVGLILLVIDYTITHSFERIAEASRMKTEFISVITHQLRSPLTNLRFSLEILTSEKLSEPEEDKSEYYKILKENAQKMNVLIDKLLTVSRIESGQIPLKKQEVSLEELTKAIILKFKAFAEASNVTIELKAEKNLPKVTADPLWLEEVVENLLDNAIRYTREKGKVRIKIQGKKKKIYFEIQDEGVGIPEEEQKYIFQKFFRAKNALKRQTEGSGLGLHIAKRMLKMLGGKISFKSKEGKGTTFWFVLPLQ